MAHVAVVFLSLVLRASAAQHQPKLGEQTMFIGPNYVECVGVGPMQCLQVKFSDDKDYSLFYDRIDGFTFDEGYEYELLVEVERVDNPPADASSSQYSLVSVIRKVPVANNTLIHRHDSNQAKNLLIHRSWTLTHFEASDGSALMPVPSQLKELVTSEFLDGEIRGFGGCNSYRGRVIELFRRPLPQATTIEAADQGLRETGSIKLGPLASTRMSCGDVDAFESRFFSLLGSTDDYSITALDFDGDGRSYLMTFSSKRGPLLVYKSSSHPDVSDLYGSDWEVAHVNNGRGGVTTLISGGPRVYFKVTETEGSEKDIISGSAGCNTFRGSVEASPISTEGQKKIARTVDGTFNMTENVAVTMMMCDEPVMKQEHNVIHALVSSRYFSLKPTAGDNTSQTLELYDESGAVQISARGPNTKIGQAAIEAELVRQAVETLQSKPPARWELLYHRTANGLVNKAWNTKATAMFEAVGGGYQSQTLEMHGSTGCRNYNARVVVKAELDDSTSPSRVTLTVENISHDDDASLGECDEISKERDDGILKWLPEVKWFKYISHAEEEGRAPELDLRDADGRGVMTFELITPPSTSSVEEITG